MIRALVEGGGDELALPTLVHKQKDAAFQISCVDMGGKSNIVRLDDGFEDAIRRQVAQDFNDFVVLLDRDVRFAPYDTLQEEMEGMIRRCEDLARSQRIRVRVFWAVRSFESWVIGGLQKGDHFCGLARKLNKAIPGDTCAYPENPKEWLIERLEDRRYSAGTLDCLTRQMRLNLARDRNESLREFLDSI